MEQKPVSHVMAGLFIGIVLILYSIILYFTGQRQNTVLGILSAVIFIAGLIYFIQQYGKANNYRLTFGKLFTYGFKATAIATLIGVVFTVVFILLFPDIKEQALEEARVKMEANPDMTDTQIQQALDFTRKGFMVFGIAGVLLGDLVIGLIGSLIGAAVTKKDTSPHPSPMDQLDQL